jgi:hypothetical protein
MRWHTCSDKGPLVNYPAITKMAFVTLKPTHSQDTVSDTNGLTVRVTVRESISLVASHRRKGAAPIEGGGAAAELVQDDQGVAAGVLQDGGRLCALHQEGALTGQDAVLRACAQQGPVSADDAG